MRRAAVLRPAPVAEDGVPQVPGWEEALDCLSWEEELVAALEEESPRGEVPSRPVQTVKSES